MERETKGSIQLERDQNRVVFQLKGMVDSRVLESCNIPQQVQKMLEGDVEQFLFDFRFISQLDCSILGLVAHLVQAHRTVKVVCQPDNPIFQNLNYLKLFSVLMQFSTLQEALERN